MIPLLTKFDPMAMVNPKTQADRTALLLEALAELYILEGCIDRLFPNDPAPTDQPKAPQ